MFIQRNFLDDLILRISHKDSVTVAKYTLIFCLLHSIYQLITLSFFFFFLFCIVFEKLLYLATQYIGLHLIFLICASPQWIDLLRDDIFLNCCQSFKLYLGCVTKIVYGSDSLTSPFKKKASCSLCNGNTKNNFVFS